MTYANRTITVNMDKELKLNILDWQEHQLQGIEAVKQVSDVFSVLARASSEIGFEYFAYGLQMPLPLTDPKRCFINNYSEDWQQRYSEKNYVEVDPTVRHGLNSVMPLLWTERVFETCLDFRDDAQAHGIRFGWTQACCGSNGVRGLLTLARSEVPLSRTELHHSMSKMLWLVHAAHESLSSLLIEKFFPKSKEELTEREIDVLRWSADGKTAFEVGVILSISERTANFHINNAVRKLGASNKTAGVIKAALLNLL